MKSLGQLPADLDDEMRALNEDIREGTDLSSPYKPVPKDDTPSDD